MAAPRLIAVVIGLALTQVPTVGSDQSDFTRLFAQYRSTEADGAIAEFASWPDARTLRDATLPPGINDPMSLAALALFHLEAGLMKAGFTRDDTGVLPRQLMAHGDAGMALVERLLPLAKASTDPRFLIFCRDWYVAINTVSRITPGWIPGGFNLDSPRQGMGDDPQILALLGTSAANQMGPFRGDGPYGFRSAFDLSGRRIPTLTADGETYDADDVRRAETFFRKALDSNPSFAEARLRLARVLQLTNRRRNAIVEFDTALSNANAVGDRFTAYLAALFKGQALEDAGQLTDAIDAYAQATERYPPGIIARLAQGQALIFAGRTDEGWAAVRSTFSSPADSRVRDPWVLFSTFGFQQTTARLAKMRSLVSQTPLRSVPLGPHTPELATRESQSPVVSEETPLATRSQTPSFRGGVDAVRVEAFVTDDGGPVTSLSARDFIVSDSGIPQRVTDSGRAGMLAIAVVVDSSHSMGRGPSWSQVQTVTGAINRALSSDDVVSVVTTADRIELKADRWPGGDRLGRLFASLAPEPRSLTGIWDGAMASMGLVANSPGRSLVVVVSDGFDNASWFDRKRTIERLKRLGVIVDAVTVPWRGRNQGLNEHDNSDVASGSISFHGPVTAAGSREFLATDANLARELAHRFATLRESYVLMYTPENVKPQKDGWHDIKVTLRPGVKGKVQARPGYYAPVKK